MSHISGSTLFTNSAVFIHGVYQKSCRYSQTSVARTLMAGLPWRFELVLESAGKKSYSCRFGII